MKKTLIILIIVLFGACPTHAQETDLRAQRDSLRSLFDATVVMLDSLTGSNILLVQQVEKLNSQVTTLKKEVTKILKEKNETLTALIEARKIIADQDKTINRLEAEIKRLSQAKKN